MNKKQYVLLSLLSFFYVLHSSEEPAHKKMKLSTNKIEDQLKIYRTNKAQAHKLHTTNFHALEDTKRTDHIKKAVAYQQTIPAQTRVLKNSDLKLYIAQFIPENEIAERQKSLHSAVFNNDLITAKSDCSLLQFYGSTATPPCNYIQSVKGSNTNTLLHEAVALQKRYSNPRLQKLYCGKKECIIKMLIDYDCDVNAKDNQGITPLDMASNELHLKAIKFLYQAGADMNAKDSDNENALHSAIVGISYFLNNDGVNIDHGIEIIETLVYLGVDMNAQNNKNKTALKLLLSQSFNNPKAQESAKKLKQTLKKLGAK